MRLITIAAYSFAFVMFTLLVIWSVFMFKVVKYEFIDNLDLVIYQRKNRLEHLLSVTQDSNILSIYDDVKLQKSNTLVSKDLIKDTSLYMNGKFSSYRMLKSHTTIRGEQYQLTVLYPNMNNREVIDVVAFTVPPLLLAVLICFFFLSRQLNRWLWRPFSQLLEEMRQLRFDTHRSPQFKLTNIVEFKELQQSIMELTDKNEAIFMQQKLFTENASHEIQTPLSIIQNKLELMFQEPMDDVQAQIVNDVFVTCQRLSKLNETLLLLAKIDNKQFPEKTMVFFEPLVKQILLVFEEQAENRQIKTSVAVSSKVSIRTNLSLIEILLTNLIRNAYNHNVLNGFVEIRIDEESIQVRNKGLPLSVPPEKLFDRFQRDTSLIKGSGLGLSIVKSICDRKGWILSYIYHEEVHELNVKYG